jgi:hypothetical protein
MTIVRCPRCRDEVTAPPRASGRALVRCPLCLEQYLLGEALLNAPPELILLSPGAISSGAISRGPIAGQPAGGLEEIADDAADYRLETSTFGQSAIHAGGPNADAARAPRPALRGGYRPRRKEKSIVAEIAKVIIGGVLGLSIGLLVLWHWFNQDPLDVGPQIARYAPWIVPEQFQGTAKPGKTSTSSATGATIGSADASTKSGEKSPAKRKRKSPQRNSEGMSAVEDENVSPSAVDQKPSEPLSADTGEKRTEVGPIGFERGSLPDIAPPDLGRAEVQDASRPPMPDLTDLLDKLPFASPKRPAEEREF